MYGFSQDEKHLLFIDCFGLTRLSRPKKVKTDRKVSGSESGGLATVSRDGSAASSYEDLWNKSVLWSFPALKASTRFDRFREKGLVVHPDGLRYLLADGGSVVVKPMSKGVLLPLRLDAEEDEEDKPPQPVTLELAGGEKLPALELGVGKPDVPAPLRVHHDGTLLVYAGGELIRAQLDGSEARVSWRRQLRAPERAFLSVYGDARRTVLVLHRGTRWTVIEHGPAGERRFEIESLAVPVVAGQWLAYQPTPDQVIRRDLDSDEQSEHSLEIYDKKRKFELQNTGPGTIFAGDGGSLLFLAGHRESILDLIEGVEISRKLPAKQLELRQAILANARPYCEAARAVGVNIELGRVELQDKYSSVSVTHRIAGGDSLAGALLGSYAQSAWSNLQLPGGWRMGSYGSHGAVSYGEAATAEAVREVYGALAEVGVGLAGTIGFWADAFERRSSGWGYAGDSKEPCTREAAGLLARALVALVGEGAAVKLDFDALARLGAPSADEVIEAFARYPERTEELDSTTTTLAGYLFNFLYGADAAPIWVRVFFDAEGWSYYGSHYGDFGRHAVEPLLKAHPETAAVFKAWFDEHGLPDDDRRWALEEIHRRVSS